jgi:anti-sigma factor RsiW
MNCREVEPLLSAYLDGELDLAHSLEVEAHLRQCEPCARALKSLEDMSAAVLAAPRFPASEELRRRFGRQRAGHAWQTAPWLVAAASLAIAALAIWRLTPAPAGPAADPLQREIVQNHIRSLLAEHLLDVSSSDRQTVKPWFSGRLDYAPEVEDLSGQGFTLAGGRLDYLGERAVAALIYHRGQHAVNVFVWPAPGQPDRAPAARRIEGFNVVGWRTKGMEWWAVSDLNAVELEELPLCPCFMPPNRTLHASTSAGAPRNPS